jgi:hypothetical protein
MAIAVRRETPEGIAGYLEQGKNPLALHIGMVNSPEKLL